MKPVTALATHRFLVRVAFSAANVFAWVMVFQYINSSGWGLNDSLAQTALLYMLSQAVTCLKLPFAASRLRHGIRDNVIYALFAATAALLFLGATLSGYLAQFPWVGLIVFALAIGAYRALYRLPYTIDAREQHLHAPSAISDMIVALVPACAGILLAVAISSYALLYALVALVFVSILPFLFVPNSYEGFPWDYRETFHRLFSDQHRRLLWQSLLRGTEATALFLLWPILVFILLQHSFASLGVIFSLTILVGILLHDTGRALLQRWQVHDSGTVEAAIVASAWIGRLAVLSPISVLLVDSYANVSSPREHLPPAHYERAADSGLYVDERTVLKEMGESLGRMFSCFIAAVFAFTFSITFAFITCFALAAVAAAIGVGLNRLSVRAL